ncbi:MAG: glycosyltransferase [Desulfobaccales bacterium]
MKILNISPAFQPLWNFGGSVVTSFEVARELSRQGHSVFTLVTDARRQSQQILPISTDTFYNGIQVRCCKKWGPAPPFWSPELRMQVRWRATRHDIALIRSCWTYVGVAASRECRRAHLPYLAYPEGSLDPWTRRYGHLKKKIWWHLGEHSYLQGAAAIVALSGAERDHLRSMGLTNRIEVIPNGIYFSDLNEMAGRPEVETQWEPLRGKRWILYLGRLHPKKGLDLLIPAFAELSRRFPDHVLVIAGPDEGEAKQVQKMVEDCGIRERVLLTGPVYGKIKIGLMRGADAFALTSYSEGMPMAVLEALGCGIPVLLTQACNVPEVAEEEAGFVVPPAVEKISQALGEIIRDDRLRQEMGRKAKQLAKSRFTWDRVARQTIALCRDILGSSGN